MLGHLCGVLPHFMHDKKVQELQFHNLLYEASRDYN